MGTNFYWKCEREFTIELLTGVRKIVCIDSDDPDVHIGKRSASGKYCYRCMVTLCKDGESKVHYGGTWHNHCPTCLQSDKVDGSCSFSWAQDSALVLPICKRNLMIAVIVDEYERAYTGQESLDVFARCPITFRSMVGEYFS